MGQVLTEVGGRPLRHMFKYTIGTLVTDMDQYRDCVRSFETAGFDGDDCQFLYIDNSVRNSHTAYDGLNHILNHGQGEFIILCHQDVLLEFDGRRVLDERLSALSVLNPSWGLAGNAGGVAPGELAIRITDPHGGDRKTHSFPVSVSSLDENFIVVRADARLAFSADLSGFHFYGTDICLLADVQGLKSYVIDFHLRHLSGGNKSPSFYDGEAALARKYATAFRWRWIQTTCTVFYLSGNPLRLRMSAGLAKMARALIARLHKVRSYLNSNPLSSLTKYIKVRSD